MSSESVQVRDFFFYMQWTLPVRFTTLTALTTPPTPLLCVLVCLLGQCSWTFDLPQMYPHDLWAETCLVSEVCFISFVPEQWWKIVFRKINNTIFTLASNCQAFILYCVCARHRVTTAVPAATNKLRSIINNEILLVPLYIVYLVELSKATSPKTELLRPIL